ncbi:MAG: pseudaminic acid cytidylyltransferase [Paracoccaceae bacterium]
MSLCIIPARGGSKRIPRKNVRPFAGRPMIAWSIAAALASGAFTRVIVSTDDAEIAEIARAEGAEVPFLRPANLSDDHTPTVPVIAHALTEAEALWGEMAKACCLYATAPFVRAGDLAAARDLLDTSGADYAFPVTSFPFPIQRGVRLRGDGRVEMFQPEHALTRSQDLEEGYHDAGQFYWGRREAWLAGKTLIGPGSAALVIPRHRVQDIDTPEDWDRAERMFAVLGDD